MSLLMFDGFDGYDSYTDLTTMGMWHTGYSGTSIQSPGRTGLGKYYKITGDNAKVRWYFGSNKYNTDLYIGFALNLTGSLSQTIFYVGNSADNSQCSIIANRPSATTYYLDAYRGGTLLASGTILLNTETWYYIQLHIKCHDSTGAFGCKIENINNFTEFTGNTLNTGLNEAHFFTFSVGNFFDGSFAVNIDDMYICDSAGTFNNTYLGEVIAKQVPLTGDSSIALSRFSGATNYESVDEVLGAPDDASTYVYSSTPGARDEYTLDNTSGTDTIFGVKVNTRAKKDNVNPRSIKYGIKTGTDQRESTAILGANYSNYQTFHETYDGTNQWTTAKLDAAVATLEVV